MEYKSNKYDDHHSIKSVFIVHIKNDIICVCSTREIADHLASKHEEVAYFCGVEEPEFSVTEANYYDVFV